MRLVYFTLAWAAGITVANQVLVLTPSAWLVMGLLLAIIAALLRTHRNLRLIVIALMMFGFGGLRMSLYPATSPLTTYHSAGGLTLTGVVVDTPDIRDDRTLLRIEAEQVNLGGAIVLTSGLALIEAPISLSVRYGDRITATGVLTTPAEYDTFSYADYLARSGVFSLMRNAIVEIQTHDQGNPLTAALFDLRTRAQNLIAQAIPEPQAGLLTGILLGNERGISPELSEDFRTVGAAHVIAISGFNMAIVGGVINGFFRRRFPRRQWLAGSATIAILVLYTLLVGANAAVARAAVMSSLLVIAQFLRRNAYLPASVAFAALLLSIFNPTVLGDIGFQLSFAATLGLALFATPLQRRFEDWLERWSSVSQAARFSAFFADPLIVTIATLVFTLPLTALYFNRVSLVVLPVNLLIVPVQAFLLLSGGLATLIAFILPALAQPIYWLCMVLLSWTIEVVRGFARMPFAETTFAIDSRLVLALFTLTIGWMMLRAAQPEWWLAVRRFIQRRTVVTTTLTASFAVIVLTFGLGVSRPDGQLHVWLLDVGHSNAVMLQTPNGAQILMDGGRFPSRLLTAIGDRMPFNDRDIEVVFITHPDEFDISALPAVLARYATGVIITNGQDNLNATSTELQTVFATRQVQPVTAGYTLNFDDGTQIEILNPQTPPELGTSFGESTLVLRVTYGDVSFLLPSDLDITGQQPLLKSGQKLTATVLQLPDHGTRKSLDAEFLAAVQPSLVLIQSDRANPQGDPHGDILGMLGNIPVYRTDQHGTIHLWTDGRDLWLLPETRTITQ